MVEAGQKAGSAIERFARRPAIAGQELHAAQGGQRLRQLAAELRLLEDLQRFTVPSQRGGKISARLFELPEGAQSHPFRIARLHSPGRDQRALVISRRGTEIALQAIDLRCLVQHVPNAADDAALLCRVARAIEERSGRGEIALLAQCLGQVVRNGEERRRRKLHAAPDGIVELLQGLAAIADSVVAPASAVGGRGQSIQGANAGQGVPLLRGQQQRGVECRFALFVLG